MLIDEFLNKNSSFDTILDPIRSIYYDNQKLSCKNEENIISRLNELVDFLNKIFSYRHIRLTSCVKQTQWKHNYDFKKGCVY